MGSLRKPITRNGWPDQRCRSCPAAWSQRMGPNTRRQPILPHEWYTPDYEDITSNILYSTRCSNFVHCRQLRRLSPFTKLSWTWSQRVWWKVRSWRVQHSPTCGLEGRLHKWRNQEVIYTHRSHLYTKLSFYYRDCSGPIIFIKAGHPCLGGVISVEYLPQMCSNHEETYYVRRA